MYRGPETHYNLYTFKLQRGFNQDRTDNSFMVLSELCKHLSQGHVQVRAVYGVRARTVAWCVYSLMLAGWRVFLSAPGNPLGLRAKHNLMLSVLSLHSHAAWVNRTIQSVYTWVNLTLCWVLRACM